MRITVVLRDGSEFTADAQSQLFHFTPPGGEEVIFCVPKLAELAQTEPELWETIDVPCDEEGAAIVFSRGGLSPARLREMSSERAEEPGLAVFLEDGSFLIIDGNHRFYRRFTDGKLSMRFHVTPAPNWHTALLDIEATARLIRSRRR